MEVNNWKKIFILIFACTLFGQLHAMENIFNMMNNPMMQNMMNNMMQQQQQQQYYQQQAQQQYKAEH
jgi:hypothetical protein